MRQVRLSSSCLDKELQGLIRARLQLTGSMTAVVKNMDRAMQDMNLERVRRCHLALHCSLCLRCAVRAQCFGLSSRISHDCPHLLQISAVMDKFESQFEDMDVQTGYLEGTLASDSAVAAPSDQIDLLMSQVADEAGLEVQHELQGRTTEQVPQLETPKQAVSEEAEEALAQRLRALRPATS